MEAFAQKARVRVRGVRDETIGDRRSQIDGSIVDSTEPQVRAVVRERARVEEGLESRDRVVVVHDVQSLSGGEGAPCCSHHVDVIAHPRNGRPPRNAESPLDVLANLSAESEIEPTARHS